MNDQIKTAVMIHSMDPVTRIINYEIRHNVYLKTSTLTSFSAIYTPKQGDKLWFYPGCTIPRFKLKQFCNAHGTALVKYIDKANVKFTSEESISEILMNNSANAMGKEEFITWLDTVMCNAYMQLRADVVNSGCNFVYMTHQAGNSFLDKKLFGNKRLPDNSTTYKYGIKHIPDEKLSLFTSMMTDPEIYLQDSLLVHLNTGAIMDQNMYDDIQRLFKTSDKENTKLAMEAMANCDFQKSAVYLLLILKEHGQVIFDSGNRNHVNFKSLLKYFNIKEITRISVDGMINALRHQNLLSVDNLNRLMPLAMDVIRTEGNMENIKIKDVELSPEAELSVANNILDKPDQEIQTQEPEYTIAPTLDSAPGAFK